MAGRSAVAKRQVHRIANGVPVIAAIFAEVSTAKRTFDLNGERNSAGADSGHSPPPVECNIYAARRSQPVILLNAKRFPKP